MKEVDIIIPTYKPDEGLQELVHRLQRMTIRPKKIIIMNTDRRFWADHAVFHAPNIELHHIEAEEFDHGRTRNAGIRYGHSEYFVCMTQDALPKNKFLLEELLAGMQDAVKLVYARQIPNRSAGEIERFTRGFNYPAEGLIKSLKDKEALGIKLYFASNVCACFERKSFERIGGFREGIILNEDMLYAHDLLHEGGSIAYCPNAMVWHSHEYSGIQQLRRNFDIGVSQTEHADVFGGFRSESEGMRLVKLTIRELIKKKKAHLIPKLIYISGCKYIGYFLGRRYRKLPKELLNFCTASGKYFAVREKG